MVLSIISFIISCGALVATLLYRRTYRRIVALKDEQIQELIHINNDLLNKNLGLNQMMNTSKKSFRIAKDRYCYYVFAAILSGQRDLIKIFPFDDEESQILAKNEAEELLDTLNGKWSCL